MSGTTEPEGSLRARKRRRARDAIVAAALELFSERGFDNVTVTDIAARAEVGRTTFFRYFGDKQEVLFSDEGIDSALDAAFERADGVDGDTAGPIGDSLAAAVGYLRPAVVAYVEGITADRDLYTLHERLVAEHPELTARSVVKQRRYADLMAERLVANGAHRGTASLAAELALACFYAGRDAAGNEPKRLARAVDAAFERILPGLDRGPSI